MGKLWAGVGKQFMFDFYENLRNILSDGSALLVVRENFYQIIITVNC